MDKIELADLRRDFVSRSLDERDVDPDPFVQFSNWMSEALASEVIDANAMTVATVGSDGRPSTRVVLLKGFDRDGFVFFTNYDSKKATDLAENPDTVFHFYWAPLDRQVGIYGQVSRIPREESEEYFLSRPVESRLAAWASDQSRTISSRAELEERFQEFKDRFGDDVPPLPHWGGFRLRPDKFEFWQGRPSRLHDRIVYGMTTDGWRISRLAP